MKTLVHVIQYHRFVKDQPCLLSVYSTYRVHFKIIFFLSLQDTSQHSDLPVTLAAGIE